MVVEERFPGELKTLRADNVRLRRLMMCPNPVQYCMKMTPEAAPLGSFPLVAGTGFEPATSGL